MTQKFAMGLKSKISIIGSGICLITLTLSLFLVPSYASAATVYNFGDIQFTLNIQTSKSPGGPWTNQNFIRVGKDADFYVKTTITLSGLKDRNGASQQSLTLNQDQIYFSGLLNSNKTITGIGPSFVSKVDLNYVKQYADTHNGETPPVPCYQESVASGQKIAAEVVVIGGAAAITVATGGGAAVAAGATAAFGTSAAGSGVLAGALLAIGTSGAVSGGIAGAAGAGVGAAAANSWIPINGNSYIKCDGPVRPQPISSSSTYKVGDVVFDKEVQVSRSAYSGLGLSQTASAQNANAVNEFYVVPDTYFSVWGGLRADDFTSSIGAGKSVYVQLYDSQAEADTHSTESPPSSVPNNGSNTGGGQNVGESGGLLSFFNQLLGIILGFLQEFIYLVFYWLLAPIIQAMLSIHTYTDTFAAVIYPGWEIIRNICNILFIIAIMAIAMGTLLRVESYQYKHLLVQLIIAALLVNFSLVVAQAILGVADTIQSQFLPNNVDVIRSLARDLMVGYRSVVYNANFSSQGGNFATTIQPLVYLTLSLGSFLLFGAIAIFLTIRVVALWVLLMVSPIAYVAGILPATSSARSKWWSEFLKYAFFTPIMAFFLNLTAIIASTYKTNPVLQSIQTGQIAIGDNSLSTFVFAVGSNILLLVFLAAAIQIASGFGVFGASAVAEWVKKGTLFPAAFLGQTVGNKIKKEYDKATAGLAAGGWLSRQAFKVTHPAAFIKGIREESKKERELYASRVEAGAQEVARKQFGWRRRTESPMFLFDEHKGKELYEEEEGEWSDNEQIVIGIGNRLMEEAKKGDLRAQIKLKHWFTEALRHKNLNEAMEGDNGLAVNHLPLKKKLNYNSNNIRYFFQELSKAGVGIDEHFTSEFLKKLSKDGYEVGDFNAVELVYNDENNHPHMIEMEYAGNGDALPAGWSQYVPKREEIINKVWNAARAEATTEATTELGSGATTDEINKLTNEKLGERGVEIQNKISKLEDDEAAINHNYANSMHAERARRYMKVNMSKKKGGQQMDMFHDSLLNVGVEDGKIRISDAGQEVFGRFTKPKLYSLARDNMSQKTIDKFMYYIKAFQKDKTKGRQLIENDLEQVIRANNREAGVQMSDTQLKHEVAEQRNMWLSGGYLLLSGEQAVALKNITGDKDVDGAYDELEKAIDKYSK